MIGVIIVWDYGDVALTWRGFVIFSLRGIGTVVHNTLIAIGVRLSVIVR